MTSPPPPPGPLVVAVGGNALLRPGDPVDGPSQRRNAARAATALAGIPALASGGAVVLTHGSGPQVGLLADGQDLPLALLDAEAAGMIGHLLDLELANVLPGRRFATVLTHVEVDPADPAFAVPTKPIGPAGHRRLVASPEPLGIVELAAISLLAGTGTVVVCGGGGGIPVVLDAATGRRATVDAVVDKDLCTALIAIGLDAEGLVLLTDVDAVYDRWGTPEASPIGVATADDLRARLGGGAFPAGSMGPKVEAACRFVEATGRPAHIGALDLAAAVAEGTSGTMVTPAATAGGGVASPPTRG